MQGTDKQSFQIKKIRGRLYVQENLETDMSGAIAGQTTHIKIILIFLVTFICVLLSIVSGYLGGITSLYISVDTQLRLGYSLMIFVLVSWLLTTIYQGWSRGILLAILAVFISITGTSLLAGLGLLELPEQFFFATSVLIVVGLVICNICFYFLRFTAALFDVLFPKHRWVWMTSRLSSILINSLAATIGSGVAVSAAKTNGTWLKDILPKLTEIEQLTLTIIAIFSGILLTLILTLSSWWVNYYQDVPWRYPDLLRSWTLAVGSWRATSFSNLDLSGINFRGAKLANTDLRARKLYRTCFQGVIGLERARVDSRYMDLENPKVQKLLTHGYSETKDLSQLNLRGAYLQNADLRQLDFTDTDLTGADLQNVDLRGSILVRTQVIGVDFTGTNLTGICIQDWSVNSQTNFTNVECEYIYRKLDDQGEPSDRYPLEGENFEPREFESLYQEVGNVVELVFKEGVNWRAFAFTLQKLQIEDDGLGLELKGIEKRGDLWVVKVTHNENAPKEVVEQRLNGVYPEMLNLLATKEQQINKLLGIAADQAEALKGYSKQPFGNSFFITGSTITNLAGSGEIDYDEAAGQVRSIVAHGSNLDAVNAKAQNLLNQLQGQSVATTSNQQAELIQQVIITEANKDPFFKQFLLQQGQQITSAMPESVITTAMQAAISQLS
ncbi:MAG: pentapeptide repeat-containing protein [Aulosira sp. DedQUE10]|nr:pentapeptide repeat-containing protein [Aulosira sp. DedQUE10]